MSRKLIAAESFRTFLGGSRGASHQHHFAQTSTRGFRHKARLDQDISRFRTGAPPAQIRFKQFGWTADFSRLKSTSWR